MKKPIIFWTVLLGISVLVTGCKNGDKQKNDMEESTAKTSISNKGQLCFQNVYPYQDNPSTQDVLELNLTIDGNTVSGNYNWLPAEKDQRKGTLNGTLTDDNVTAQYHFMQEGMEQTAMLKIRLMDDKAQVEGGEAELGLGATIDKIDCGT
ncbi:hypothetical protein [Maribacter cobaltidurans]|uniref:Uncharacterized protein n=1 Tax=Maribacter cobaltidurans TaxID=1178778 RepID=A0A223V6I2_9FLAO|nr:hypothetical protein [Maribacter cobaltidurans]ASV30730.1 hypothetical protein CJ263_11160 [Maribacter cobaltidurans]GGD81286.1 hypothetical protein GCM10011412_18780 [Maribacter cobaltidurans]